MVALMSPKPKKPPQAENSKKTATKVKPQDTLLTGNGCHKLVGIVQGILVTENSLLIPGGELVVKISKRCKGYLKKYPETTQGIKTYIGYPKIIEGQIRLFEIVGIEVKDSLPECWEIIGTWCSDLDSLVVQRDIKMFNTLNKLPSFIPDLDYHRKVWINNNCYKVTCKREGTKLTIEEVRLWACPVKNNKNK